MNIINLEKNIEDTLKEWQLKIGYQEEAVGLYYPDVTLAELLELDTCTEELLKKALAVFLKETKERLGKIRISVKNNRYCLEIPKEGCRYVAESVKDPELLCGLLKILNQKQKSMDEVRELFFRYAAEHNGVCVEKDETDQGLGHVFYFEKEETEPYVYCIEQDAFGITYHRFTRSDYEKIKNGEESHD